MTKKNLSKTNSRKLDEKKVSKGVSQWNIAWRRFKKNKAALAGAFIIGFVIFLSAFDALLVNIVWQLTCLGDFYIFFDIQG